MDGNRLVECRSGFEILKKREVTSSCSWSTSPISFPPLARVIASNGSLIAFKCIFCYFNKLLYWIPDTELADRSAKLWTPIPELSVQISAKTSAMLAEAFRGFLSSSGKFWGSARLCHIRFLQIPFPILYPSTLCRLATVRVAKWSPEYTYKRDQSRNTHIWRISIWIYISNAEERTLHTSIPVISKLLSGRCILWFSFSVKPKSVISFVRTI